MTKHYFQLIMIKIILYLYYLRIYNTALTPIEIIQNYKYEELIKR